MNSKKALLGITLVLLIIGFIPGTLGYHTIKRSLDTDWFRETETMPRNNPTIGWWASEELIMFPHHDSSWFPVIPIWECDDYHGHIIDREMRDGRRIITVTIVVKGAPVMVETFNPDSSITLFEGKINYIYQQKFIINLSIWPNMLVGWLDDDGYEDDTGYVILPTYYIPALDNFLKSIGYGTMGLDFVSVLFVGTGKGIMLNSWNDLNSGDNARLHFAAFGSAKKGFNLISLPYANDAPFGDIWPLDFIKLY